MKLQVETDLRFTEDQEKVVRALKNLFDLEKIEIVESGRFYKVIGYSDQVSSLKRFRERIWSQRILDTARSIMLSSLSNNRIEFKLHKQAAYTGRVSFVDDERESSLGAIRVVIETSNPNELIDWIAPKTSRGRPLWVKEMPENV
ncbi:MAG: RNA-binding domain-containing protein [Sulfolobales archaeon]